MIAQTESLTQTYQNVMELLVQEELEIQLKQYPETLTRYINKVEVSTYALNRLPSLYASCEKGRNMQTLIGRQQYRDEVKKAVRQALAAVQRDPLRVSKPLVIESDEEYYSATIALNNLHDLLEEEDLLDYQALNWDNLVDVVRHALAKTSLTGKTPKSSRQPHRNISDNASENVDWADIRYTH
jgi:hypothetical protein